MLTRQPESFISFQNGSRTILSGLSREKHVPTHWSMFIPHMDGDVKGKIIHAVDSPFTGYQLEIKGYDISKTKKSYEKISLGFIDEGWLPYLNSKAEGVKPPGVSQKPLDPFAVSQAIFQNRV